MHAFFLKVVECTQLNYITVSHWLKGNAFTKRAFTWTLDLYTTDDSDYVLCKWTLYTKHDMRGICSHHTQTNNHQRAKRLLVKAVFCSLLDGPVLHQMAIAFLFLYILICSLYCTCLLTCFGMKLLLLFALLLHYTACI